ncbi:MAG: ATP-grasp domain-containing protein [Arenicellaceae bacterium]|nr:ATP-grasp domain-containing protein [Arenicellaceae bacterium]
MRRLLMTRLNSLALVERCTDKLIMKDFLAEADIPMTAYTPAKKSLDLKRVSKELKLPLVLKDRKNSGGRGTIVSSNLEEIEKNLSADRLLEKYVNAPEASVESFIHDRKILFTNMTQYFKKGEVNIVPANFKKAEINRILELNAKVLEALKIKWGVTHLEVYRSKIGPLFGEIALRPPGGYIMDLISLSYGFNAWEAFLDLEMGLAPQVKRPNDLYSAAVLLHPGEGTLLKITGWEKVLANSAVVKHRLKVKEGERIGPRKAVSEEVGHISLRASFHPALIDAVSAVEESLKFSIRKDNQ